MYGLLCRWLLKEHPFGAVISPTLPTYFIIKIILEKNKIIDFIESAERFIATCAYSLLRFPLPPHHLPLLLVVLEMKSRIMCF